MKVAGLSRHVRRFLRDSEGASAVEYGVIAGAIMVAIILIVYQLGDTVAADYQSVADSW